MSEASTALTLRNFGGEITVAPDFYEARDAAIEVAKSIKDVTDHATLEKATDAIRELARLRRGIESARKSVKQPFLDKGKEIDRLAESAIGDAEKAEKELTGKINHFQRQELERQEAARRAAEQAQREAEAAQRKAEQEAERLRIEAEASRQREEQLRQQAEHANTQAARDKAAAEAEKARREAAEAENARLEQQLAAEEAAMTTPAVIAEPEQTKGVTARRVLDFQVEGRTELEQKINLLKLGAKYPDAVDIKPRTTTIRDRLNGKSTPFDEDQPPGIRVFGDIKTSIR